MTKYAYYNEFEPYVAEWLRNLIKAGLIAPGEVDERSIEDVHPEDLKGFAQCHFFAGIGGWSRALRLAGWPDDREVWTGSCPCQPFSSAGRHKGFDDERHLWPSWAWLIRQRRPAVVFGEQVANKDGRAWIYSVQTHLEAEDYAFGGLVIPACSVGAPHQRNRLWFVAADRGGPHGVEHAGRFRPHPEPRGGGGPGEAEGRGELLDGPEGRGAAGELADTPGFGDREARAERDRRAQPERGGEVGGVADPQGARERDLERGAAAAEAEERDGLRAGTDRRGGADQLADADRDGLRVEPAERGGAAGVHGAAEQAGDGAGPVGDADGERDGHVQGLEVLEPGRDGPVDGPGRAGGARQDGADFWAEAVWLPCRDGNFRPTQPGLSPLAYGVSNRVGRLRAFGNAIVPQVAAQVIGAFMDLRP